MPSIRRFDVCVPQPKGDRPSDGVWWLRIGSASENDRGQISLFIDTLPIKGWDGRAMCFEQKSKEERQASRGMKEDDDIPI